ncbi:MAG TPA: tetratricopeptide repeat protein [Vicinamibacterales bacterium]|nr:tetratricopeptide repeat protein [Vicinamibacterales bacterium]
MAPFDREAALKTAEKALRQGRIEVAITEYVKIVEAQPKDWNTANALGDLYVRANQVDKGLAQFTRIADHFAAEGFFPKAAALYKKVLKVKPDDEYALLQSGDIAAKQGLLADAKNAFKVVAERRKARGDKKGAAEINIRIGTLDPEDLDARLGAARAAVEMGDTPTALREFRDVAFKLEKQDRAAEALAAFQAAFELSPADTAVRTRLLNGYLRSGDVARARAVASGASELKDVAAALEAAGRMDDVLDVLAQVATLDPGDLQVRAGLAQAYAAKGDMARARTYLSAETAGRSAPLWLALAEIELSSGRLEEGRAAVAEALAIDATQREAGVALGCRLAEASPDAGYQCIDVVADAALQDKDFAAAAAALHEFVTRVRYHVIALMRLVEVCVDGGLEATMYEAQAQLADAYLEVGRGLEARIISEDLVAREPWNRANIERFRRALVMLGEADPDGIIAERLSGESPFLATDKLDLNEGIFFEDDPPPPAVVRAPVPVPVQAQVQEEEVIDLDSALFDEPEPSPPAPTAASPAAAPGTAPRSLEQVFQQRREEAGRDSAEEAAAEQYQLALTYRDLGMIDESMTALEAAVRSPRQRFDAAALLAAMHLERGDTAHAIEWFERAAEAPAPTPDANHALLYDLAATLEQSGEHARALAVFVELDAESGGYRDVAARIDQLSKAQSKR